MTPADHGFQLFDVSRTTTAKCAVCGELREPNEETVRHCPVDLERREGDWVKRPVGCLNSYDPAHVDVPY